MTPFSGSATQRADRRDDQQHLASWYTPGLSDGLGDRLLMFDNTTASALELLRFRPEFGGAPGFEAALRQRVDALRGFGHPSVATVRSVESLGEDEGLALLSNQIVGRRLSEILREAHGPQFAAELIRQLVPALAALQAQGNGIAHGLITPERIVVTPEGRLVLVEHVLASAVETLRLPAGRVRSELGLAVPPGSRIARLDPRSDVVQLGYVALSLVAGRRTGTVDTAADIRQLVARQGSGRKTPAHLEDWLVRALQLSPSPFDSAHDAARALADWPDHELESEPSVVRFDTYPSRPMKEGVTMSTERSSAAPLDDPLSNLDWELESEPHTRREAPLRPYRLEAPAGSQHPLADALRRERTVPVLASREELNWPAPPPVAAETPQRLSRAATWTIVGLSVLSVAEGLFIAGLLIGRPAAATSGAAATAGASAPAAAVAPPLQKPAAAPTDGRIDIASEPTGARVVIDDVPAGTTPLSTTLRAGEHSVVITAGRSTTRHTVHVTAGATASLLTSLSPPGATGGWVSIDAPLDLQVHEAGSLLGSTKAARIMLPAGRHVLTISSSALGFEHNLTVDIEAGRTVTTKVPVPNGSLSLNAIPWANVWVDGQPAGTTPVANLAVPIGSHEVVWRHPELGERRQTVVVTTKAAGRLVIDLRK
jgi:serine/threonine-protein kinase